MFEYLDFMPRAMCMNHDPLLIFLYVLGNFTTFISYMLISWDFVKSIKMISHAIFTKPLLILTGAFVLACGLGHALDIVMMWWPVYRFQVVYEIITGVISIVAASWFRLTMRDAREADKELLLSG